MSLSDALLVGAPWELELAGFACSVFGDDEGDVAGWLSGGVGFVVEEDDGVGVLFDCAAFS